MLAEVRRIKREIAKLCEVAEDLGDGRLGDQFEGLEAKLDDCLAVRGVGDVVLRATCGYNPSHTNAPRCWSSSFPQQSGSHYVQDHAIGSGPLAHLNCGHARCGRQVGEVSILWQHCTVSATVRYSILKTTQAVGQRCCVIDILHAEFA